MRSAFDRSKDPVCAAEGKEKWEKHRSAANMRRTPKPARRPTDRLKERMNVIFT